MKGCLVIIVFFMLCMAFAAACIPGNPNDDGDDSNDCYYTEPIPHWDECR